MTAAALTRLIHYVLDSYHEVWLHGCPNTFLFHLEELDGGYYAQWPQLPQFMPRIMRLLSALGFWRGHPAEVERCWRWCWRFWDPFEFDGFAFTTAERRLHLRHALRFFFTGRFL